MMFEVRSILPELDRSEAEARSLIEGLSQEQINFRPDAGAAWSISQCLDHLSKVNTTYAAALISALAKAPRQPGREPPPIRPGWPSRSFIRAMDAPPPGEHSPKPRMKFSAPPKVVPDQNKAGDVALREFIASHDSIRALLKDSQGADFNRLRFKNPFVRGLRFTVGAGILIILAHDRRHLWQARRVREALPTAS